MKRLTLLTVGVMLLWSSSAYALIVTPNTDPDNFESRTTRAFATQDLTSSMSSVYIPVSGAAGNMEVRDSALSHKGAIVGMSIALARPLAAGGVTAEITINRAGTGIQAVVDGGPTRAAVGSAGSTGTQFGYIQHPRGETQTRQGFRASTDEEQKHDRSNPFGVTTALAVGDRLGVVITTSSDIAPGGNDIVVSVDATQ